MPIDRDSHEVNRLSWNAVTPAHNSHKGDQAAFLRSGGSTLFPDELELLGDLVGKRLVHLQCNCGQDTLSLAALGAIVTGVDISDEAVAFAGRLSDKSGIAATFERADIFDWFDRAEAETFDIAFSSYGAIGWISDIPAWARGVAKVLKTGGKLVLVEFHPTLWLFDEKLKLAYSYTTHGTPIVDIGVSDYVAASGIGLVPWGYEAGITDYLNPHPSSEFAWGLADVIGSLIDAGLRLQAFREMMYSNGCRFFEGMRPAPGNRWWMPEGVPEIPLMYGISAGR